MNNQAKKGRKQFIRLDKWISINVQKIISFRKRNSKNASSYKSCYAKLNIEFTKLNLKAIV